MRAPDTSPASLPGELADAARGRRHTGVTPEAPDSLHGRLLRKYLLLILSLVTSVLLVSSAIGVHFSYRENKAALASLQQEKAVGAASRIEQYVQQVSQLLAHASLAQLDAGDLAARRAEFWRLLRQAPEVTDIALIDGAGREQIAVSRLGLDALGSGRDRSQEPAFREARTGAAWYGPVYFNRDTEPYMSVAVRADTGAGPARGPVTVAELNLKFIWEVVSRIRIGERGKAYVVDGQGLLVADPDIGLVLRKTSLASLPHVHALAAEPGAPPRAMVSRDLHGATVLTSVAPIPALDWEVFVEQPIGEVYATLDAAFLRAAALLLVGLAVSALAASLLARRMVRPIRTLARGARRIGQGDLNQRIEVDTGDELEGLAQQFNRMASQLRESYGELERKVAQRTAELSAALEHQTATAGILRVISRSPIDLPPVLHAVAERATMLCQAHGCRIWLPEDPAEGTPWLRALTAYLALPVPGPAPPGGHADRLPATGGSVIGRAFVEGHAVHVPDVLPLLDGEYPDSREPQTRHGFRTVLAVPMRREGACFGVIALMRTEVRPFDEAQVRLVETFADQAVIAIENARLFREIEDKGRQLEIANRHKSAFLAHMSHELRTPLNAIIGFSEVLIERMFGEVNDKQLEYLRDIHASGQHLLALINDVLDLSKIEAGHMALELSRFDFGQLLHNATTLVRERAQRQGLALTVSVDPALGDWVADARKLKQVVVNLLSNAVKFTPAGGRVELSARLEEQAGGPVVRVCVADTGVGIAPADQALVFEEFRQAGGDSLSKAEGTGLGLPLARRFVALHGGTLTLVSRPGEGSCFTFTVPMAAQEVVA